LADGTNQRSATRVQVEAFVKVEDQSREYVFRTRDLSEAGVFLYTKVAHIYPFRVGASLRLELYDYDTFVSCRVVVARVVTSRSEEAATYPVGFGVRIVEISEEEREKLRSILARAERGEELY
jgi:hypothetical protein